MKLIIVSVGRKPPFRARQKSPIKVNLKNPPILKAIPSERRRKISLCVCDVIS